MKWIKINKTTQEQRRGMLINPTQISRVIEPFDTGIYRVVLKEMECDSDGYYDNVVLWVESPPYKEFLNMIEGE